MYEERPPKGPINSLSGHHTTKPNSVSRTTSLTDSGTQCRMRRAASWRLPVLDSRRADPWWYEPPSAGYEAAAHHLLGHGLTPAPNVTALRGMWNCGGAGRAAAEIVAERWGLTA